MKIVHYSREKGKSFDDGVARGVTGRVVVGKEDGAPNFCMRVFEVAPRGHTPRHVHDWEHEIFVHGGRGAVFHQGQWRSVAAGDAIFVPPRQEHQLKNTGEETFTFVCLVPSGVPEL